jgi:hypothetical protein
MTDIELAKNLLLDKICWECWYDLADECAFEGPKPKPKEETCEHWKKRIE